MRDLVQDRAYALKICEEGLSEQDIHNYLHWSLDVILEATERAIIAESMTSKLKSEIHSLLARILAGDAQCPNASPADKQ